MKPTICRPRLLLRYAAVLCCCAYLVSGGTAAAQKAPSVFNTDVKSDPDPCSSKSTSASNIEYIICLESTYRTAETTDKETAKRLRNKLIYISVEQIDEVFQGYRTKKRKRGEWLQFLLDFLEVGASTAIAITNGERAKEVIAEALTGFKGGRSSLNKNFKLLETQILFNKMVANRSARLKEIYDKLNNDVVSYPWERARSELRTYLYAGTIDDALTSLSIETGDEAGDQQKALEETKRRAGVFSAPTAAEVLASTTNAKALDAILEAYDAADTKADAADKAIADADKAIAAADKATADADKRISDERAKAVPDQTAIDVAEAAKKQAATDKTKATADRAKAVTDKDAATKAMDANLSKLKGIYQAVSDDAALAPLIDKIPAEYGGSSPDFKAKLEESIARLKAKKGTFDDYALIVPKIGGVAVRNISKDPTLSDRLKTILEVNK
jgi:hypothetical protein